MTGAAGVRASRKELPLSHQIYHPQLETLSAHKRTRRISDDDDAAAERRSAMPSAAFEDSGLRTARPRPQTLRLTPTYPLVCHVSAV